MSIESFCRLCVTKSPTYLSKNIEQLKNEQLDLLIFQYLQINITDEDNLPNMACNLCCETLYEFDQFLVRIKLAQQKLNEIFPNSQVTNLNIKLENEESYSNQNIFKSKLEGVLTNTQIEAIHVKSEGDYVSEDISNDFLSNETRHSKHETNNDGNFEKLCKKILKNNSKIFKKEKSPIDVNNEESSSANIKVIPFKCYKCNFEVQTAQHLQDHFKTMHDDSNTEYVCVECNALFDKLFEYESHYDEHDVVKNSRKYRYVCKLCGKKFRHKSLFTAHEDSHLGIKRFSCNECGSKFRLKQRLTAHELTHNKLHKDGSAKCNQCDKICKNQTLLERHLKTHIPIDEKYKYKCDVCSRKFVSDENLKIHQKQIHGGNEEYICEQCGKVCKNKYRLAEHLNTHNDRIFNCDECSKGFKSMQVLKIHKLTHSGEKLYGCEVCGKKFSRRGQLTIHSSIHTGKLPHECSYCKKQFRQKYYLKVHLRQHTGERPYSCTECNHFFANDANFIKHLKGKHGLRKFSIVNKRRYPFDD